MKFVADENIEGPIVALLRSEGHDVRYVAEESAGIDDDTVIATANADDRILLTSDKDFGELVFLGRRATSGIVLLRLGSERTTDKLVSIRELLARHADSPRLHRSGRTPEEPDAGRRSRTPVAQGSSARSDCRRSGQLVAVPQQSHVPSMCRKNAPSSGTERNRCPLSCIDMSSESRGL